MKIEDTFVATIYIGAKEHYDGKIHQYCEVKEICQNYSNEIHLCVTIKELEYIYKNGNELGFAIGLINYPRFPATPEEITKKALQLGKIFRRKFNQYRISIVCSDKTYTIEEEDL